MKASASRAKRQGPSFRGKYLIVFLARAPSVLPYYHAELLHPGADAHDHDGHVLLRAWAWKLQKFDDLTSVHTVSKTARDLIYRGPFCIWR
jgi:hypothetical protein